MISSRTVAIILYDILMAILAWVGTYWLYSNLAMPPELMSGALSALIWVVPVQALIFWHFGLYRGIWRFASLPDLKRIM